jgi:hypothetical protein
VSNNFPGGLIRKTPVTPAGPLQNGAAPGMWTLAEASFWTKQGLWPLAGNIFAVEDVFSTWLYTGNSSTQTITNGINLSGQGGMVWLKRRNADGVSYLADTARGPGFIVQSSTTTQQQFSASGYVSGFNNNGFQITAGPNFSAYNESGQSYVSWTFREAPNFFDVVTYTGTGVNRTIAHNLGSVPGCIIIKRTDTTGDWQVYHRSNANTQYMVLNTTAAVATGATRWNSTTPTASVFSVGTDATVNASGGTYVAYLFAHDAGGFGPTLTDNIISCGSYTGNGSATGPVVTLGYEPQWLMVKRATGGTGNWQILDNMRGLPVGSADATLQANLSNAETSVDYVSPTATGFQVVSTSSEVNTNTSTYIYVAIRRGPMKTPTLGTSVFNATFGTGGGTPWFKAGFPVDFGLFPNRAAGNQSWNGSRLTGETYMAMVNTDAEGADPSQKWDYMNGYRADTTASTGYIGYSFRRAPGFMDVVCYTGTGVARTVNHNLGVVPELMIVKGRASAVTIPWTVYSSALGATKYLLMNSTAGTDTLSSIWNDTAPTASVFSTGNAGYTNRSGSTYVAYLFASVPGVSKVGSYTGNGSSQTINCAFTTGARFVLIKRTDSTGDWYVWDSARGIVAGNDPYLALNSTAAEVTSDDSVDTENTGFVVNQVAASNINVNAATYIFLAIA